MKKLFVFLLIIVCNIYCAFSQEITDKITFYYSGLDSIPPCYLQDDYVWKTSHGSPCYVAYTNSGFYDNLLFATDYKNQTQRSEGAFTDYTFEKCFKYRIEISLRATKNMPNIEVYAANNLTDNPETNCNTAVPPTIPENNKDLIGWDYASCNTGPGVYCTKYFPSKNSYWTPDKEYTQLWIAASLSSTDSTSFMIGSITIYSVNLVITPPTVPGNLHIFSTTGSTISVAWDPSTAENGFNISKYRVYCNNKTYETSNTWYVINNLEECTSYNISVQAIDECHNASSTTTVTAKTKAKDYVVLNQPVILANYPDKTHIERAGISVTLQPGFSVKANNSQEFFKAMIGCDEYGKEMEQEDEDLYLSEEEEPQNAKNEDESQFINEEDVLKSVNSIFDINHNDFVIYPNPTTGNFTVSGEGLNHIEVYDVQGRKLLSHTANLTPQTSINVSHLQGGIYFVKMYSEMGDVVVKRLVVVK